MSPAGVCAEGGLLGFAIRGLGAYPRLMPHKPIELPPEVARAFIRDMRAFFSAGGTGVKADGIAAPSASRAQTVLPRQAEVTEVKEMFLQMKSMSE
jgi:hypothetical protein